MMTGRSARSAEMDIGRADPRKGKEQRKPEQSYNQEYRLII